MAYTCRARCCPGEQAKSLSLVDSCQLATDVTIVLPILMGNSVWCSVVLSGSWMAATVDHTPAVLCCGVGPLLTDTLHRDHRHCHMQGRTFRTIGHGLKCIGGVRMG